jgi:hypothetical protein
MQIENCLKNPSSHLEKGKHYENHYISTLTEGGEKGSGTKLV